MRRSIHLDLADIKKAICRYCNIESASNCHWEFKAVGIPDEIDGTGIEGYEVTGLELVGQRTEREVSSGFLGGKE